MKKNLRADAELVCQPPIVIVSYGPRIHFEACFAVVVFASMELSPSTLRAMPTLLPVRFRNRRTQFKSEDIYCETSRAKR